MKPPKRSRVQDICRNINERVQVAKSFRVLAESYSLNEDGFRENLKDEEYSLCSFWPRCNRSGKWKKIVRFKPLKRSTS